MVIVQNNQFLKNLRENPDKFEKMYEERYFGLVSVDSGLVHKDEQIQTINILSADQQE